MLENKNEKVIIFDDGATMLITEKEEKIILETSADWRQKNICINGNTIWFRSISKILNLNEYHKQFPDKRPEERKEFKAENYDSSKINQYFKKPKGKELMCRGLKEHCEKYPNAQNAQVLYLKMCTVDI